MHRLQGAPAGVTRAVHRKESALVSRSWFVALFPAWGSGGLDTPGRGVGVVSGADDVMASTCWYGGVHAFIVSGLFLLPSV